MFKSLNFSLLSVLILLFFASGSIFQTLGINNYIQLIVLLCIFLISIKNGAFRKKNNITYLILIIFFTLAFFILQTLKIGTISILLNNNNLSLLILITTCILTSYYVNTKKNFLFNLNFILLILTLHGIFSSILISIFPTENVIFTTYDGGSKYVGYFNLFFQRTHVNYFGYLEPSYINHFGFNFKRAHGIAWEPGNYAAFVNILIFLNLFIFKNIRFVIIGVLGVILSWSTTGIFLMFLQFSYLYIKNLKKKSIKNILPKIIIGLTSLIILFSILDSNYKQKIYGSESGSGAVRIVNTIASFITIYENPLLGTGFYWLNYQNELHKQLEYSKSISSDYVDTDKVNENSSFTNSFLMLFSQLGIPLSLLLMIALFKQNLVPKNKLLFGTIIIISTSTAPILITPFFFLFIIDGVLNIIRK